MAYQIFLSYRNSDTQHISGRLYEKLAWEFGPDAVFRDRDGIDSGEKWPERIKTALEECAVLLAIIGPNWYHAQDQNGKRRLDLPGDWVRKEIETVLKDERKTVIPVIADGATYKTDPKAYPKAISSLTQIQPFQIQGWNKDMPPLLERLRALVAPAVADNPYFDIIPVATLEPKHLLYTRAEERNGFRPFYYKRPYVDDKLYENYSQGIHTIVVGKSLSGKSRALLHLAERLSNQGIQVLLPKRIPVKKDPFVLPRISNGLVLINDIDRYLEEDGALWMLEEMLRSGRFRLMATCWPEKVQAVRETLLTEIENFVLLPVPPLTSKEKMWLAQNAPEKRFSLPDDTIGSYYLPLEKARTDFQRLKDNSLEKEILRSCKVQYYWNPATRAGFSKALILEFTAHRMMVFHGITKLIPPGKWQKAFSRLNSVGLIQDAGNKVLVEEVYLLHFFMENPDDFVREYAYFVGDELSFARAIKRSKAAENREQLMKEYEKRTGHKSVILFTSLLNKTGSFQEAIGVLERMKEDGVRPNDVTFSTLLGKANFFKHGIEVLEHMKSTNIFPNYKMFSLIFKTVSNFEEGLEILERMKAAGFMPSKKLYNNFIQKAEGIKEGFKVLRIMKMSNFKIRMGVYLTLINKAIDIEQCIEVIKQMQAAKIALDIIIFNKILNKTNNFIEGVEVLELMKLQKVSPDIKTFNKLLNSVNNLEQGILVLKLMKEEGVEPNISIFNKLLNKTENFDNCITVFDLLLASKLVPTSGTYFILLLKVDHFDQGKDVIKRMQNEGFDPGVKAFNMCIYLAFPTGC